VLGRDDVTGLGEVLAGSEAGRSSDDEITAFDSTGLAIQDLAIALAAVERLEAEPDARELRDLQYVEIG
jgi:ornithine cyclodeaminase/alanine dehydrogenase-like protein (mu-crystallin family)